jgi:pyridoxal phosphate enzyme (YggS family)
MTNIADNLKIVRSKIDAAARAAGRDHADPMTAVTLVAVTKTHPVEAVQAALAVGQRIFGENRVQEAKTKYSDLRTTYSDLELHLIGPLQTNKAEDAVTLFDVIETLDRPKLADALAAAIRKTGRKPVFYIEINIGAETQKAGIAPDELGNFLRYCRDDCGLNVAGLMCIPPQGQDPAPFFSRMRELAFQHNLPHLSMGMSADFETAIREGATSVRVGTAIFGARDYSEST